MDAPDGPGPPPPGANRPPNTSHNTLPGPPRDPDPPPPPPSTTPPDHCRPSTPSAPRRRRSSERSPTGDDADQYRHTVARVPPGLPSVAFGWVWKPRVCVAHSTPVDGRNPGGSPQIQPRTDLLELGAPNPHHRDRSRRSGVALLHDINSGRRQATAQGCVRPRLLR